jgi:hypothetical protein
LPEKNVDIEKRYLDNIKQLSTSSTPELQESYVRFIAHHTQNELRQSRYFKYFRDDFELFLEAKKSDVNCQMALLKNCSNLYQIISGADFISRVVDTIEADSTGELLKEFVDQGAAILDYLIIKRHQKLSEIEGLLSQAKQIFRVWEIVVKGGLSWRLEYGCLKIFDAVINKSLLEDTIFDPKVTVDSTQRAEEVMTQCRSWMSFARQRLSSSNSEVGRLIGEMLVHTYSFVSLLESRHPLERILEELTRSKGYSDRLRSVHLVECSLKLAHPHTVVNVFLPLLLGMIAKEKTVTVVSGFLKILPLFAPFLHKCVKFEAKLRSTLSQLPDTFKDASKEFLTRMQAAISDFEKAKQNSPQKQKLDKKWALREERAEVITRKQVEKLNSAHEIRSEPLRNLKLGKMTGLPVSTAILSKYYNASLVKPVKFLAKQNSLKLKPSFREDTSMVEKPSIQPFIPAVVNPLKKPAKLASLAKPNHLNRLLTGANKTIETEDCKKKINKFTIRIGGKENKKDQRQSSVSRVEGDFRAKGGRSMPHNNTGAYGGV